MEWKLPRVGQRIVRSVCAVCLCFIIYYIRGCRGIPFYSALAVLQCIQPYRDSSLEVAKKRTLGTFIGAFWGLLVIVAELYLFRGRLQGTFLNYMIISLFTGVVIYSTVLMKCKNTSYFSCVVFLSITVMHLKDESPALFVMNRVLDTLIGVAVALMVNSAHLPRVKNKDILFVSGIDDTLLTSRQKLTDYSRVELNRLIDAGANFTVSTIRTPASVRETLDGVKLKLPIIAMDGAVLYDMQENRFLESFQMTYEQAVRIMKLLREEAINFFTNVVVEDFLVIYYDQLENEAERKIYEKLKKSPYRNYARRELPRGEQVVYFMLIYRKERVREIYEKLMAQPWIGEYKILMYDSHDYPGFSYIKIYQKDASRKHMLQKLLARQKISRAVVFGSVEGNCDVLIRDSNKNTMVRELKRRFEPVGITVRR